MGKRIIIKTSEINIAQQSRSQNYLEVNDMLSFMDVLIKFFLHINYWQQKRFGGGGREENSSGFSIL